MELYDSKYVYFDWDNNLEGKKGFFADNIVDLKQNVKDNRALWYGDIYHSNNDNYPFKLIDDNASNSFRFCYYDPYYKFRRAYLEGKTIQFKDYKGDWEDVKGEPLFNGGRDVYRIKPETWYIILDNYGLSRSNSTVKDGYVVFEGSEEECIEWMEKYKQFEKIMVAWKQDKAIQYKEDDEWKDWLLSDIPRTGAFAAWKEWRIKPESEYVPFDSVQELIDAWDSKYPQNKSRPEGTMPLIWIKNKVKNRVYLITDFLFDKYFNDDVGTEDSNLQLKELFEDFTFLDNSIIGKVKE